LKFTTQKEKETFALLLLNQNFYFPIITENLRRKLSNGSLPRVFEMRDWAISCGILSCPDCSSRSHEPFPPERAPSWGRHNVTFRWQAELSLASLDTQD